MKRNAAKTMQQGSLQMLGNTKNERPRGKIGFCSGLMIGFLSIMVLIALFSIALWFDLFSLKYEVVLLMQLEKTQMDIIEQRQLEVETQEADLLALKQELEDESEVLERQSQRLLTLEASLNRTETELNRRAEQISTQEAEIDELVAIYEQMPPEKAAEILLIGEDRILTAQILNRITPQRLTMILTQLSAQDAASLINLIAGSTHEETSLQPEAEGSTP